MGNSNPTVLFTITGKLRQIAGGMGNKILVSCNHFSYSGHPVPFSKRFLAPGRSCKGKPETNINRAVKNIQPTMEASLDSPWLLTPFRLLEAVFLDIANSLSEESNNPEDDTDDVRSLSKARLSKPKNLKKLPRLSSKRSSLPVLRIRKRRNPANRLAHTMRKIVATICLAFVVPDMDNVMMARMTKFEPPQKSVSLSNLRSGARVSACWRFRPHQLNRSEVLKLGGLQLVVAECK
ncbi:hypothetical protein KC349_g48 [Hortaea werneckii]|nr:hypothetical protein KC349_g48 [Hortaea werneckii]